MSKMIAQEGVGSVRRRKCCRGSKRLSGPPTGFSSGFRLDAAASKRTFFFGYLRVNEQTLYVLFQISLFIVLFLFQFSYPGFNISQFLLVSSQAEKKSFCRRLEMIKKSQELLFIGQKHILKVSNREPAIVTQGSKIT